MANPSIGSRYVSVNLNKSYGKPSSAGGGRARPSGHGSGGMVVLSRPRSSVSSGQKGPRLSVPPPLNLPSLRKEHEKIDPSSNNFAGTGVGPGLGSASSGIGWTKFQPSRIGEGDAKIASIGPSATQRMVGEDGSARAIVYTPPGTHEEPVPTVDGHRAVEKVVLLRGEDFPSLQASLPVAQSPFRQKDLQRQKQLQSDVELKEKELQLSDGVLDSPFPFPMRPQVKLRGNASRADDNGSLMVPSEKTRKDEGIMSGPLPMVRLRHFDWADDERDTGYKPEHSRVHLPSRNERDRELNVPKSEIQYSVGIGGTMNSLSMDRNSRGTSILDAGRVALRDVYGREPPSNRNGRDENFWRGLLARKDGYGARDAGIEQNVSGFVRLTSSEKATDDRVSYARNSLQIYSKDSAWDGPTVSVNGPQNSRSQESYSSGLYEQIGQKGNHSVEVLAGRGTGQSSHNRQGKPSSWIGGSKSNVALNSITSRSSFSSREKGFPVNDPILNFGKGKRTFLHNGNPYIEDAFIDGGDPFVTDIRVFKKKDVPKNAEFYDPLRESFEAELERVQKMQEQERQRVLEERARALELARKEEEERARLATEEAERRRRLEEEAKEAAWRAERERLEAARRADEQKRALEEEKRQMFLEEERRKEAARRKLLELEARIARRQAEAANDEKPTRSVEETVPVSPKDKEHSMIVAGSRWEDRERVVDRLATSASSESSNLNRSSGAGSRPHSSREGNPIGMDRTNVGSWSSDLHDSDSSSASFVKDNNPNHDVVPWGKGLSSREFHGGPGYMATRGFSKVSAPDIHMNDDVSRMKVQKWNCAVDDHYSRRLNDDIEYAENSMDGFGDLGWEKGQVRGGPHVLYSERLFQNSEIKGVSSGRARHIVRQPRVLPPPSLISTKRCFSRVDDEPFNSSAFVDGESGHQIPLHTDAEFSESRYGGSHHQNRQQSVLVNVPDENTISLERNEDKGTLRCDSQSSLSVSSMPNSPTHLSHDDIEDVGGPNAMRTDYEQVGMSDNDNVISLETANKVTTASFTSVSPGEDDWIVESNAGTREQEEYDEEEDAYQEDDLHEGDEENFDLAKDFTGLHLEQQVQTGMLPRVSDLENGLKDRLAECNDFVKSETGLQQAAPGFKSEQRPSTSLLVGIVQDTYENDQSKNDSYGLRVPASTEETKKTLQESVLPPMSAPNLQLSSAKHVDNVVESSLSVSSAEQLHASVMISSSSSQALQPVLCALSSVSTRTEVCAPMQFGLFSEPTLMSSPSPAIQIGSIQMPLHIHPQVCPPLTHLHPPQPPIFLFGQLSYSAPITQGILQIPPQPVSSVQPTLSTHHSIGQQSTVSLHSQPGQEHPRNSHSTNVSIDNLEYKQPLAPKLGGLRQENLTNGTSSLPTTENIDSIGDKIASHADNSLFSANDFGSELLSTAGDQVNKDAVTKKMQRHMINNRRSQDEIRGELIPSSTCPSERVSSRVRAVGKMPSTRGGRVVYSVKSAAREHLRPISEALQVEPNNFRRKGQRVVHRSEFRVRGSISRRQIDVSGSYSYDEQDLSVSNGRVSGRTSKGGGRKDFGIDKTTRLPLRHESSMSSGHTNNHASEPERTMEKTFCSEVPTKRQTSSQKDQRSANRNLKGNILTEEDVDASLQSGIVRVFNQPGIEMPSDEDDFIEVRSKRQMLNDRREQREKEIKAKSRAGKGSRKPQALPKTDARSLNSNKTPVSLAADGGPLASSVICAEPSISDGMDLKQNNVELTLPFTSTVTSQPLPPISLPAASTDFPADNRPLSVKSLQENSFPDISSRGDLVPGLSFENNSGVLENSSSLGSWVNAHVNHVMPLTQTQLDEAMKTTRFDAQVSPPIDHTNLVRDTSKGATSILGPEKSFSPSANSLNSLLAGKKIHFGAVTSPTILPASSCATLSGVGPAVSCISDVPIECKLSAIKGDCMRFFDKEKHSEESCVQLEDPEAEAEAEAAASAVAVAAISIDEPAGNGLAAGSAPITGGASTLPVSSLSRSEESFSVTLPADLSVETPIVSLWPPSPSPQSSSSQMPSHFHEATHCHFSCFEMSPILNGPIFTFGQHDEPTDGHQLQVQKSNPSASGSPSAWQQHHSGVDSFYGPPSGFTGPFINPPGAIPGVQGPPHMVVYNHFAPVGQFGQMGLRLMGTTYIPSGKQPDWKHVPVCSAAGGLNDNNISSLNMVPGQCDPSISLPIQHLSPGSPLMPIASPLGLFDMSPFQPPADLSVQGRWSHVPAPSVHSVPLSGGVSLPLQQTEVVPARQFNRTTNLESRGSRFTEDLSSKPAESGKTFPTNDAASQFPDELGLGDTSCGNGSLPIPNSKQSSYKTVNSMVQNGSEGTSTTTSNVGESSAISASSNGICSSTNGSQSSGSTLNRQSPHLEISSQAYLHSIGYKEQKGRGRTQRIGSASEWPRRHGFSGSTNHIGGADKNFSTSKIKKIYVVKPASSSTSAN